MILRKHSIRLALLFVVMGLSPAAWAQVNITNGALSSLIPPVGPNDPAWVAWNPSWSPADDSVAFKLITHTQQNIWVASPRGFSLRNLTNYPNAVFMPGVTTDYPGSPIWSPAGGEIFFVHGEATGLQLAFSSIARLDAVTAAVQDLTPTNLVAEEPFAVSPDGTTVVFAARQFGDPTFSTNLYSVLRDGSGVRLLAGTPLNSFNPSWSPDGQKIAFQVTPNPVVINTSSGPGAIYVSDPDGGRALQVTDPTTTDGADATKPSWSTDGNLIAFVCNADLCTMGRDGSNVRNLTQGPRAAGRLSDSVDNISWAIDGALAFDSSVNATCACPAGPCACPANQVFVINPDGSGLVQWTTDGTVDPLAAENEFPQFSPSQGTEIVYMCRSGDLGNDGDLCVIAAPAPPSGGTPPVCTPANCNGCCFRDGCHLGTTNDACGPAGAACDQCQFGTTCDPSLLRCVSTGVCGPGNCAGCCGQDGLCYLGHDNGHCGHGGFNCQTCATGSICDQTSNSCVVRPICTPSNCGGCCGTDNLCHLGGTNDACGANGLACQVCGPGTTCDASARFCVQAKPKCDETNCNGCCDASGKCQFGTTAAACGAGGRACTPCTGGAHCDNTMHACRIAQSCGPDNCSGCCTPDGVCHLGFGNDGCGFGGFSCEICDGVTSVCDPSALFCVSRAPCSSGNCTGCCDSTGTCQRGVTNAACGFAGFNCEVCTGTSHCDPAALFCVF